eukprot:1694885-Amphidinium_carterae.1
MALPARNVRQRAAAGRTLAKQCPIPATGIDAYVRRGGRWLSSACWNSLLVETMSSFESERNPYGITCPPSCLLTGLHAGAIFFS